MMHAKDLQHSQSDEEAKYHSLVGYVYIILSAIIIGYITKITLKSAIKIKDVMGTTGMNVMSKVFSLLLLALSIELVTDGLRNMFPHLSVESVKHWPSGR